MLNGLNSEAPSHRDQPLDERSFSARSSLRVIERGFDHPGRIRLSACQPLYLESSGVLEPGRFDAPINPLGVDLAVSVGPGR